MNDPYDELFENLAEPNIERTVINRHRIKGVGRSQDVLTFEHTYDDEGNLITHNYTESLNLGCSHQLAHGDKVVQCLGCGSFTCLVCTKICSASGLAHTCCPRCGVYYIDDIPYCELHYRQAKRAMAVAAVFSFIGRIFFMPDKG